MSTVGAVACCVRLCGARGFSNDRSLMYWALTINRCEESASAAAGAATGAGAAAGVPSWPFFLVVLAMIAPLLCSRAAFANMDRPGPQHGPRRRSVPALLAGGRPHPYVIA